MLTRVCAVAAVAAALAGLARGDGPKTPLRLAVELPKEPATVTQLNGGEYPIQLAFTNAGNQNLVIWPYAGLEVKDALNQTIPATTKSGRWGKTAGGSILEQVQFVIVKPGQVYNLSVNLATYKGDPDVVKGWTLKPGNYTLVFSYEYDPAAAKKKYGRGGNDLDNATKLWNRALKA